MSQIPTDLITAPGDDLAPGFDFSISGHAVVKGTALYEQVRQLVSEIMFEEDEELSSMLEFLVINQPDDKLGAPVDWSAVLDSKAWAEGNFLDLYLGYGAVRYFVDRLVIDKWLPDFPEAGPLTMKLKAFDGRQKMADENRIKAMQGAGSGERFHRKEIKTGRKTFYKNMSDEDIVKKVAAKYGYGADCDATEVRKVLAGKGTPTKRKRSRKRKNRTGGKTSTPAPRVEMMKPGESFFKDAARAIKKAAQAAKPKYIIPARIQGADQTDWQFLRKLAELNHFDVWVDYDLEKKQFVVHFKRRQDATCSPQYAFEYHAAGNGTLLAAQPEFQIHLQTTDVEILSFDKKRKVFERTVISEDKPAEDVNVATARLGHLRAEKELGVGAKVRFAAFGQSFEAFANRPFRNRKEAARFVQDWLRERERDMMTLTGKVIGVPSLRARQVHEFRGMSTRIDGFYRLTNVKHNMKPGSIYTCDFVAYKLLSDTIVKRKAATSTQKPRPNTGAAFERLSNKLFKIARGPRPTGP